MKYFLDKTLWRACSIKKSTQIDFIEKHKMVDFSNKENLSWANEHMEKINTKQNWYSHKIDKNIYIIYNKI